MTEQPVLAARVAHLERELAVLRARQVDTTGKYATVAARLDNIDETLVQHSAELATLTGGVDVLLGFARDHGRALADHGATLADHGATLADHSAMHAAQGQQLAELIAAVAEVAGTVTRIERRLGPAGE